ASLACETQDGTTAGNDFAVANTPRVINSSNPMPAAMTIGGTQPYVLVGPKAAVAGQAPDIHLAIDVTKGGADNTPYVGVVTGVGTPGSMNIPKQASAPTNPYTVLLRRLVNPYLPPNTSPSAGGVPNPYCTVDYMESVAVHNATTTPTYDTRGKMQ